MCGWGDMGQLFNLFHVMNDGIRYTGGGLQSQGDG